MTKRNKKANNFKIFAYSFLSLVLSFCLTFVLSVYFTLPISYTLPETLAQSSIDGGTLNVETIKSKDLSIHFLELGNKYTGDCILIDCGDTEVLVDAGSKTSSIPSIKTYIDNYVDDEIEYVIVTHAHEDHYAGFATNATTDSLFDLYKVGTIIEFQKTNKTSANAMFKNYERERDSAKNQQNQPSKKYKALQCYNNEDGASKKYNLSANVELEILTHKYYTENASSENDYSVCFMINQNNKHYLFTGDLEDVGEQSLIASNSLPRVNLFKAGHHGSKTSSSEALLNVIQPEIVVVTCNAGSPEYTSTKANQFPTQPFINRVEKQTENVFVTSLCVDYDKAEWTSLNGNIVICANDEDANVTTYFSNNSTKLKDTEWFKTNRTSQIWNVA